MAVDLTTDFCGITFKNPMIVPAGVHGRNGDVMKEVSGFGPAGICTKTIVRQPATDVLPCFTALPMGMINSVFGSDKSAEYWFTEGLKRAREGDSIVIANLAGFSPEDAANLAVNAEKAGADLIMLPTHCPHMGEILNAMYPDLSMPEPKLTDTEPMKQSVKLIKESVSVPVVVKLSGTFSHITKEWAIGVAEAGADGIASSDALGPALAVDVKTGQPKLGGPRGVGGLTGPAILPITLRMVLEIAMTVDLPIIGVGGVTSAEDIVQYIMAGASLVGVCTAGHLRGYNHYSSILKDLSSLMDDLGVEDFSEIRGLTKKRIQERKEQGKIAVTDPVPPTVDPDICISCGKCETVCAYGSAKAERNKPAVINPELCIGCGLCVSACPVKALSQVYY